MQWLFKVFNFNTFKKIAKVDVKQYAIEGTKRVFLNFG